MDRIAIVGAGQAGAALAAALRASGFSGRLTLIGDEPAPPYQRPPLSKAYLKGELTRERLFLRPARFWAEQEIALCTGAAVLAIDRAARTVQLADGAIGYDALALTTGSRPRRLPAAIGGDLPGVHVIRGLGDIDALAPAIRPGRRLLVVGGGYIGLEAAAVARERGLSVTLVEAAPRILGRVAAAETAAWFADLHRSRGVDLRVGIGIGRLTGTDRLTGAVLTDGTEIAADLAVVGIGIAPETRLAEAAGLACEGGIVVDAHGRTSDPAIWAAGDCAALPFRGGRLRLESVQNAIDGAEAVARNMLGADAPYAPQPWFWSDQYDVKLQIAGLGGGASNVVVRNGPEGRSHWYFGEGGLCAVDAINAPRAFMTAKRLLAAGVSPDPARVGDPATDLRALGP
jgi:3-phenylpropionate/trans-cinnamate dioxygenase ferredoxin reductase subunit